jgi:hypothetical protein
VTPDYFKIGITFSAIFTIIICVGTLTSLSEKVDLPGGDKLHHFIAFAALSIAMTFVNLSYWKVILPYGWMLGAIIEIIQPYVNRYGNATDFYAGAMGSLFGLAIGLMLFKLKNFLLSDVRQ